MVLAFFILNCLASNCCRRLNLWAPEPGWQIDLKKLEIDLPVITNTTKSYLVACQALSSYINVTCSPNQLVHSIDWKANAITGGPNSRFEERARSNLHAITSDVWPFCWMRQCQHKQTTLCSCDCCCYWNQHRSFVLMHLSM